MLACTTQALTTEAEEVMGLLLGDVVVVGNADEDDDGATTTTTTTTAAAANAGPAPTTGGAVPRVVVRVWRAVPQRRVDRRRDRVETSPEQVAAAAEAAANEGSAVVGWFHSHPHITPLPSHVDVATQARYQSFADSAFVGVIASVFNDDAASREQRVSVLAFQARRVGGGGGGGGGGLGGAGGGGGGEDGGGEARARAALEGLDEETRRAILEAAGGDLSAALSGTTHQGRGGGGAGAAGGGGGAGGQGDNWEARLVPLVVFSAGGAAAGSPADALPPGSAARFPADYAAVFRTLLEEERLAADARRRPRQQQRGRRRGGDGGGDGDGDAFPSLLRGQQGDDIPPGPGEEAARLLSDVRQGARRQRGACALVEGALAPAVHLARLQRQGGALRAAAEQDLARRLKGRAEEARRREGAARAAALEGLAARTGAAAQEGTAAAAAVGPA